MSQVAPSFVDIWEQAYKESVHASPPGKARFLLETIGPRIAAAAMGLADARQIKRWASSAIEKPRAKFELRLDALYWITKAISAAYSGAVAARFLRSSNPQLDGSAPLTVLATAKNESDVRQVLVSARAFLEG